jgi:hypothetical protein
MLRSNSKIGERNVELQSREGMQRLRKCVQIFEMNTNAGEEAAEMHKKKIFLTATNTLCYWLTLKGVRVSRVVISTSK